MGGGSVLWAETPDEDRDEASEPEAQGEVDESFAARRLRRWLKGMFGGRPQSGPSEGSGEPPRGAPDSEN
jgi:hypothetical protein